MLSPNIGEADDPGDVEPKVDGNVKGVPILNDGNVVAPVGLLKETKADVAGLSIYHRD
jgi:hypothetical protein